MAQNEDIPTMRADRVKPEPETRGREAGGLPPTQQMGQGQPWSYPSPAVPGYAPGPAGAMKTEVLDRPPPTFAWLVIKKGPRPGHLFRLRPDATSIGRNAQNDVILDDPAVSGMHAKVRIEKDADGEEAFYIYDLASSNGTKVNGEKIIRHRLEDDDEIEIGRTVLAFKVLREAKARAMARPEPAPEPLVQPAGGREKAPPAVDVRSRDTAVAGEETPPVTDLYRAGEGSSLATELHSRDIAVTREEAPPAADIHARDTAVIK